MPIDALQLFLYKQVFSSGMLKCLLECVVCLSTHCYSENKRLHVACNSKNHLVIAKASLQIFCLQVSVYFVKDGHFINKILFWNTIRHCHIIRYCFVIGKLSKKGMKWNNDFLFAKFCKNYFGPKYAYALFSTSVYLESF